MFTIFSNFRIRSDEQLAILDTNLRLLERVRAKEWIINIRGDLKYEAAELFKQYTLKNLCIKHIETEFGWCSDSFELSNLVTADYIIQIIEDQFLICNPLLLENIVTEMRIFNIEHLEYSWFGGAKLEGCLERIEYKDENYLKYYDLTPVTNIQRHKNYQKHFAYEGDVYAISLPSIIKTSLFRKICEYSNPQRRRFEQSTPFDFERAGVDVDYLPIRIAFPKYELFASLDDDNLVEKSSLHSRRMFVNLGSNRSQKKRITQEDNLSSTNSRLTHDIEIKVPYSLHSAKQDNSLWLRFYKYEQEHIKIFPNIKERLGQYFECLEICEQEMPSIKNILDFGSDMGMASALFLIKNENNKSYYFSENDLTSARVHENLFRNKLFKNYKLIFKEKQISINKETSGESDFVFADYTEDDNGENGDHFLFVNVNSFKTREFVELLISKLRLDEMKLVVIVGKESEFSSFSNLLEAELENCLYTKCNYSTEHYLIFKKVQISL
jgi:hypothetical protein